MQAETTKTDSEKTMRPSYRMQKRFALIGLLFYAAVLGGVSAYLPDDQPSSRMADLIMGIPVIFLLCSWCSLDAIERRNRMSTGMRVLLVLLFAIAFPVFIFRSRGLGGFKTLAYACLFAVACFVAACLSGMLCLAVGSLLGFAE